MTARTWITFITPHQAQPGRRMRWDVDAAQVWTVKELTTISGGAQQIVFAEGGRVEVDLARARWQIEV